MQGKIRGFMHLDNGQESIPAFVADTIKKARFVSAVCVYHDALSKAIDSTPSTQPVPTTDAPS